MRLRGKMGGRHGGDDDGKEADRDQRGLSRKCMTDSRDDRNEGTGKREREGGRVEKAREREKEETRVRRRKIRWQRKEAKCGWKIL